MEQLQYFCRHFRGTCAPHPCRDQVHEATPRLETPNQEDPAGKGAWTALRWAQASTHQIAWAQSSRQARLCKARGQLQKALRLPLNQVASVVVFGKECSGLQGCSGTSRIANALLNTVENTSSLVQAGTCRGTSSSRPPCLALSQGSPRLLAGPLTKRCASFQSERDKQYKSYRCSTTAGCLPVLSHSTTSFMLDFSLPESLCVFV